MCGVMSRFRWSVFLILPRPACSDPECALVFLVMQERQRPKRGTPPASETTYVEVHGPWIRHLRKLQDKEMAEFAEDADIPYGAIRKIENGHSPRVTVTTYSKLRDALGLTRQQGVFIRGNPGPEIALNDDDPEAVA